MLRFVKNFRSGSEKRETRPLTPEEVKEAERDIIRDVQRKEFSEDYTVIRNKRTTSKEQSIIQVDAKT